MNIPDSECGARGDLDLVSAGIFADLGVVVSGSVKSSANVAERALWGSPGFPDGLGWLGSRGLPGGDPLEGRPRRHRANIYDKRGRDQNQYYPTQCAHMTMQADVMGERGPRGLTPVIPRGAHPQGEIHVQKKKEKGSPTASVDTYRLRHWEETQSSS